MRARIPNSDKAKTRGLSLKPKLKDWAEKRACGAMQGFSGYVSLLIQYDQDHNILPVILNKRMKATK